MIQADTFAASANHCTNDAVTRDLSINCWFADLSSSQLLSGATIVFTVRGQRGWRAKVIQVAFAKPLLTNEDV